MPLKYARLTATPPPKLNRQYTTVERCTCPPSPDDNFEVDGGNVRAEYHLTANRNGKESPIIKRGDDFVVGKEYAVAASILPSNAEVLLFPFPLTLAAAEVVCIMTFN